MNRNDHYARVLAVIVALLAFAPPAPAGDWPGFRGGAEGKSVSAETELPAEWGPGKNVRWRVELAGRSNGSPAVWGDRVFILQGLEKENRRTVMCFDRSDGKLLWQSGVTYAEKEPMHPDNPYCSGTPVTDGERVIGCFGSAGLYCYDMAGKELWKCDLGKLNHMFGNAISPVIAGDRVFLNFGPGEGTRLVAVDKRTGEILWEAQPPKVAPSEQTMTGARLGGPAMAVVMPLMSQGDKDEDAALTADEMTRLAEAWFDKLDPQKSGKVTNEQFVERFGEFVAPPPGAPGGGGNAAKVVGPALFAAMDADKDGSLARDEMKKTFAAWQAKWGGGKGEPIDANEVLDGLNTILPRPKSNPDAPADRRGGSGMSGATGPGGSWSTPILIRVDSREELVVAFPNRLAAYDPKTGKLLWFSKGLADAVQPSPVWAEKEGLVIAMSGDMSGGNVLAVRPGGSGDVTESHRAWRLARVKGSIGSGVARDGRLYAITTDGFATCYELKDGKRLWQKRLEGEGDKRSSWSSMLLAGDRIYVPNQAGDVFVLGAGGEFDLVGTSSVSEPTNSSLAAAGGALYLRTDKALWCIGSTQ